MPLDGKDGKSQFELLQLDEFGRPIPSLDKFPSAIDGKGLKEIGDHIHSKGLKFGLHIMRGITRDAVRKNLPVFGTILHAQDIANKYDTCSWYGDSYGVNMTKPGAQEFYNSLFLQYAEWGVDFIKADDMASPYHPDEIEAVHKAIKNSGRPMVLSLSPGPAFVGAAKHLQDYANMWRISNDFWDDWKALRQMFEFCHNWTASIKPGHWPDADMLPLGKIGTGMKKPRYTNFTPNEQYCMMSLWCIFRSPLMLGGNLPENDSLTIRLITNDEVIAVNQASENNREVKLTNDYCIYTADVPNSKDKYMALFNFDDNLVKPITVTWKELGISGKFLVRDLWDKKDVGEFETEFSASINPHAGSLYRIRVQ
jgi:alpha-galactosidase